MITPMKKLYVAVRATDHEALLDALHAAAVLHLEPVDRAAARADDATLLDLQRLTRAEQILSTVTPAGTPPEFTPVAAAERVLDIFARAGEYQTRLAALTREADRLAPWGDLRLDQLEDLRAAGLVVSFASVPAPRVSAVAAEATVVVGPGLPGQRLVMAVSRHGQAITWPEGATDWELPSRDRPAVLAEAARYDQILRDDADLLGRLAHLAPAVARARAELEERAAWLAAQGGGLASESIFALKGWIPADQVPRLGARLAEAGVGAALHTSDPLPDEDPPTRIEYNAITRPMQGLFDILGTVPGYRELDVSAAFLLALPIFAAMLIADGGYGLVLLVPALLGYKWLRRKAGAPLAQLAVLIGLTSVIWGAMISSFFGLGDTQLIQAGGAWEAIGRGLSALKLIPGQYTDDEVTKRIIRLCFLIGAIHLSFAQLWRAWSRLRVTWGRWEAQGALATVGWAVALWGVLFVVNNLVLGIAIPDFAFTLLAAGGILIVVFGAPGTNPFRSFASSAGPGRVGALLLHGVVKRLALGVAGALLPAMGTLGDIISYIRLMAVGLASSILAVTFNTLAAEAAVSFTWVAGVAILVIGHALNIGLGMIALFAHGVRLNMLEFSNNLGMTWSGYPFKPFAKYDMQAEERC